MCKKNVLILTTNPFSSVETGIQRIYKEIINSNPEINFHFFCAPSEYSNREFPNNCFPIKIENEFSGKNIIAKIKGLSFDIIDIPDFLTFDSNIKKLLRINNVKYKKIYLAMHGSPSKTDGSNLNIELREKSLKYNSDKIYGISPWYVGSMLKRKVYVIDPNSFKRNHFSIHENRNTDYFSNKHQVITFIGRQEIKKGILEFIEVAKELKSFGLKVEIYGPLSLNEYDNVRIESELIFKEISVKNFYIQPKTLSSKLAEGRRIVIMPSKWESFSLVCMDIINSSNTLITNRNSGLYKSMKNKEIHNLHIYKRSKNRKKEVDNIVKIILSIIDNDSKKLKIPSKRVSDLFEWKYKYKQRKINLGELYD